MIKTIKHYYNSEYANLEHVLDIVLDELIALKRDNRITKDKTVDDLYVDTFGNIYAADTYPVFVSVEECHGFHDEVVYEPDMGTSVLVATSNELLDVNYRNL